MPEMQTAITASATSPIVLEIPALDDDIALGCECADPSLQIERWMQEAQGLGTAS